MNFAESKFGDQIKVAWQDFNITDLPVPADAYPGEQQIFMPYFLFQWDPQGRALERAPAGQMGSSPGGTS
jgi:hypothetical protein